MVVYREVCPEGSKINVLGGGGGVYNYIME